MSLERLALVRLIYAIYYGAPQGAPPFDLEAYFFGMLESMLRLVEAAMAQGELKQESAEDVARAIIAIVTSSINEQLCRRDSKVDREGMVRMLNLLMSGIAP